MLRINKAGQRFVIRSPFYTGKKHTAPPGGRVEQFRKRYGTKENATPTSQS